MAAIHYYEKQKFRQWWLIALLLLVTFIPVGIIISEIYSKGELVFSRVQLMPMLVTLIGPAIIFLLFTLVYFEIEVDEYFISYKFFPFHFSSKKIYWEDVQRAYVRQYSPLGEFGGWGIRYSFRGGKAFNVAGNKGLQLELKNGKKILFGIQKKEELAAVMNQLYAKNKVAA